jgi:ubiquinone/menaquinone biosynthesis C-methylase UbiE
MSSSPSSPSPTQTPTSGSSASPSSWPNGQRLPTTADGNHTFHPFQIFDNPFSMEDLAIFDAPTLHRFLHDDSLHLSIEDLACGLSTSPAALREHIEHALSPPERSQFRMLLRRLLTEEERHTIRQQVLDKLFWELIYWKRPDLYDELTEGEQLHRGIFQSLQPHIHEKVVLDAASGTGRATLECLRRGARQVYAVDPSPAALSLLAQKVAHSPAADRAVTLQGCFEELPLEKSTVDIAVSCSAFKASEACLGELLRVTKPGGKIVLIWPRAEDYTWLAERGFRYVSFSPNPGGRVHFRSVESALRCVSLFYAANQAAIDYLCRAQQPDIPYALLGFKQPSDYCWRMV